MKKSRFSSCKKYNELSFIFSQRRFYETKAACAVKESETD